MAEVRTQLRQDIKTALDAAMTNHTVFDNRKYAFNEETLPVVDMMVSTVEAERQSMSNTRRQTVQVMIRVTRKADSDQLDDLLDADGLAIDDALVFDETLKNSTQDFQLTEVEYRDSGEAAKAIAHMVMTYTAIICIALIAPNVPDRVYFSNGFSEGFLTRPEG